MLLTNDASFLITFDNWHSAGLGDDVVAIYDHRDKLVRKLPPMSTTFRDRSARAGGEVTTTRSWTVIVWSSSGSLHPATAGAEDRSTCRCASDSPMAW